MKNTPACRECEDCQRMLGQRGVSYRCYGLSNGFEIKQDIGAELPKTSPEWCPLRAEGGINK